MAATHKADSVGLMGMMMAWKLTSFTPNSFAYSFRSFQREKLELAGQENCLRLVILTTSLTDLSALSQMFEA